MVYSIAAFELLRAFWESPESTTAYALGMTSSLHGCKTSTYALKSMAQAQRQDSSAIRCSY